VTAEPHERYIFGVQVARQVQAMQAFLDDRDAVYGLLAAQLTGVDKHGDNRFVPRFDVEAALSIASRLGLWFDGTAYRFLLFDSEKHRERWLKGESWVDIPSDLDQFIREMESDEQPAEEVTDQ
jgi:hypothetical protein